MQDTTPRSSLGFVPAQTPAVEQAVACLRYWHGMIGQPRPALSPPFLPYEVACGSALATQDTSVFECLVPTLLLCEWDRSTLLAATAPPRWGRLRAAASLALLLSDFDRLDLPDAETRRTDLLILRDELATHDLRGDVWDNDPARLPLPLPESFWTRFFADMGLRVNWPLADFAKQYAWARQSWRARRRSAASLPPESSARAA